MSVVVGYEETGPCEKKLTIEVPQPAVEAETGRVLREFAKSIRIPGFRKGKVPPKMLRRRFGAEIDEEVQQRLIPRYWKQAEAEKSLDPLLPPTVESVEMESGQPMTFVALVDTRPAIEIGELAEFDLPELETEPTEAEVDEAVDDLRRRVARWTVVDRPAARGDRVTGRAVALDVPSEDAESEEEADDDQTPGSPIDMELGADGVDEELTLALSGLTAGQSAPYTRRPPEGAEAESPRFRLEVENVYERELPELDEDFVGAVSDFDTVDELREAISDSLRRQKEQEGTRARETALLDQLRERFPLPLPERVVEDQVQSLLGEFAEDLQNRGVDLESAPVDWERIRQDMRSTAELRVHARLLLDAVAEAQELKLDEQEFERFLGNLARARGQSAIALRHELAENGRLGSLRGELLRRQTVRHLLGDEDDTDPTPVDADDAEDAPAESES